MILKRLLKNGDIAGTIPGAIIFGLTGNKIGSELDRRKKK